jgi:hypothetical protein
VPLAQHKSYATTTMFSVVKAGAEYHIPMQASSARTAGCCATWKVTCAVRTVTVAASPCTGICTMQSDRTSRLVIIT